MSKNKSKGTGRNIKRNLKTKKGRTNSSQRWLERQLNDPYVKEAEMQGYRSRAVFKIKEIDEKLDLIKPGMTIIDLGAAPGGWSQYAIEKGAEKVVALDLLEIDPIPGVTFLQMDFMDDDAPEALIDAIGGGVDLVLSDMAPNTIGHKQTDHLRIMNLVELAHHFAAEVLKPGGGFVSKVFQGGTEQTLLKTLRQDFAVVKHVKPKSSRQQSAEQFVVALGYKGNDV